VLVEVVAPMHKSLGRKLIRTENCSLASVRRVAAMLDLDPDKFSQGDHLPRGWQFILLGSDTRRGALRADGFGGLGDLVSDIALPRLRLSSRSVEYFHDIPIGATLRRTSTITTDANNSKDARRSISATACHELYVAESMTPALVETQTYRLLGEHIGPVRDDRGEASTIPRAESMETFVPDDTMLFQYSALGFNSHKIHIDRIYARSVEGLPDLVVNGGLVTLLLTELLRRELGQYPKTLSVQHLAPLYCGRPLTLTANRADTHWQLAAFDELGRAAVAMQVQSL
jgi:3-methylfumaryl-CoA hydratase